MGKKSVKNGMDDENLPITPNRSKAYGDLSPPPLLAGGSFLLHFFWSETMTDKPDYLVRTPKELDGKKI